MECFRLGRAGFHHSRAAVLAAAAATRQGGDEQEDQCEHSDLGCVAGKPSWLGVLEIC
jgi:hypothetical protein